MQYKSTKALSNASYSKDTFIVDFIVSCESLVFHTPNKKNPIRQNTLLFSHLMKFIEKTNKNSFLRQNSSIGCLFFVIERNTDAERNKNIAFKWFPTKPEFYNFVLGKYYILYTEHSLLRYYAKASLRWRKSIDVKSVSNFLLHRRTPICVMFFFQFQYLNSVFFINDDEKSD